MNSPYLHFFNLNNCLCRIQNFLRIDTIFLYNNISQKYKRLEVNTFTEFKSHYKILHNAYFFLYMDKNRITDKIRCIETKLFNSYLNTIYLKENLIFIFTSTDPK